MAHITLAVTHRVAQQVQTGNLFQRQLAVQHASPDLLALIGTASGANHGRVAICGVFELSIGDRGAIWGAHQAAGHQADDFADLYSLLARRPDVPVTFREEYSHYSVFIMFRHLLMHEMLHAYRIEELMLKKDWE